MRGGWGCNAAVAGLVLGCTGDGDGDGDGAGLLMVLNQAEAAAILHHMHFCCRGSSASAALFISHPHQLAIQLTHHPPVPAATPQVLFSDTVGFIQKLPTQLVAAFRATLEEIQDASLVLHVVDASHDNSEAQSGAVLQVGRLPAVVTDQFTWHAWHLLLLAGTTAYGADAARCQYAVDEVMFLIGLSALPS